MMKLLNHPIIAILLLLVLLATGFLALGLAGRSTMEGVAWQEGTYDVKRGDSLWAIASEYCPENVDRRDWIREVKDINGLSDSTIYPGQRLTVLAPEED